jgi:nucleoside-diphosphate-sugar epimerase
MMRVFVAAATGAIGKLLVPRLVAAGHEVTGMTRSESKQEMLASRRPRADASRQPQSWHRCDAAFTVVNPPARIKGPE